MEKRELFYSLLDTYCGGPLCSNYLTREYFIEQEYLFILSPSPFIWHSFTLLSSFKLVSKTVVQTNIENL